MNLQEQLAEVQKKLTELDPNNRNHLGDISKLKGQEKELLQQIEDEKLVHEREQQQEEKISAITLPYDFNEVFADQRANDIIIELIQQYQREAYAEHNAEVTQLHNEYKEQLRAAEEREIELKYQNDQLQTSLQQEKDKYDAKIAELNRTISEQKADIEDLAKKRDAAATELEKAQAEIKRLNEHIDTLRKEAAVGAKNAIKVHDVGATDKLSALVQQSIAEKAKTSYERFLERNKDVAEKLDLKPIELPEVQPVGESFRTEGDAGSEANAQDSGVRAPKVDEVTFRQGGDTETEAEVSGAGDNTADTEVAGQVSRQEFEALEKRVDHLYSRLNISEVA